MRDGAGAGGARRRVVLDESWTGARHAGGRGRRRARVRRAGAGRIAAHGRGGAVEKAPATRRCRGLRRGGRRPLLATAVGADAYAVRLRRRRGGSRSRGRSSAPASTDPAVGHVRDRADRGVAVREPAAPSRQLAQRRSGAVAGTVAMVPEGLVLLMSVAFAVASSGSRTQRARAGAAGRRRPRARRRALHRQDGDAHGGQALASSRSSRSTGTERGRRARGDRGGRRASERDDDRDRRTVPDGAAAGTPPRRAVLVRAEVERACRSASTGRGCSGAPDVLIGAGRRGDEAASAESRRRGCRVLVVARADGLRGRASSRRRSTRSRW